MANRAVMATMPTSYSTKFRVQSGYSLIELLLVCAILVSVVFLLPVDMGAAWRRADRTAHLERIEQMLSRARDRARHEGRAVSVRIRNSQLWIDGVRVEAGGSAGRWEGNPDLVFLPDGSSSGATLVLLVERRSVNFHVSPISSRVRMQ